MSKEHQSLNDKIAENIKKFRGLTGLNQKSFAKRLGISSTHLNLIENCKKKPSLNLILKISDKFDVDPAFIVTRIDSLQIFRDMF